MQLELDFRLHYPDAGAHLVNEFSKWVPGIIAAARLSRRANLIELLREYDAQPHSPEPTERDFNYAILALLHLLPSCNTRQKARLSSAELESSLIAYAPQQTCIQLFVDAKQLSKNKQPSLLCLGSKDQCGNFYLLLDAKAVDLGECGTVKAVDYLFKCHFVFWVSYGKCLALFMEFLQKVIYKIQPEKFSTRVRELPNCILTLSNSG